MKTKRKEAGIHDEYKYPMVSTSRALHSRIVCDAEVDVYLTTKRSRFAQCLYDGYRQITWGQASLG